MQLMDLFNDFINVFGLLEGEVTGVTIDPNRCQPGFLWSLLLES